MSQTSPKKCFIPKIVKNTPILIQQSIADAPDKICIDLEGCNDDLS